MVDLRDGTTWVALELTRQGEQKVEDGTLATELRSILSVDPDWPIFIPARVYHRGGRRITVHLMEGYAFVASGLNEVDYFRLEADNNKFVSRIMTASSPGGLRVLKTIPDRQIQTLRRQLVEEISSDIVTGLQVRVAEGKYKGLDGLVLGVDDEYAFVKIELRSLKIVAKIPRILLVGDDESFAN